MNDEQKHKCKHTLFCAAIIFLAASSVFANTGLSFLEIPVGARESALGGCGVALVTGPTSSVHNAAAVMFTNRSAAVMRTQHFGDVTALFAGFTLRNKSFALSPHYWGTTVPDIEYRVEPTRAPVSTFDAMNTALGGALAYKINERFAAGVGVHYIYQKISIETSDGWAMNAGLMGRNILTNGLTCGLAMQNWGHMNAMATESPRLPTTLRGGLAYERGIGSYGTVMGTAEAAAVQHNTPRFAGGLEFRAPGYVALRAGYVAGLEAQNLSLGIGLFYKQIRLDYAFIPYRENLGEGHRFALTFDI
jgi:hypothetical protein